MSIESTSTGGVSDVVMGLSEGKQLTPRWNVCWGIRSVQEDPEMLEVPFQCILLLPSVRRRLERCFIVEKWKAGPLSLSLLSRSTGLPQGFPYPAILASFRESLPRPSAGFSGLVHPALQFNLSAHLCNEVVADLRAVFFAAEAQCSLRSAVFS